MLAAHLTPPGVEVDHAALEPRAADVARQAERLARLWLTEVGRQPQGPLGLLIPAAPGARQELDPLPQPSAQAPGARLLTQGPVHYWLPLRSHTRTSPSWVPAAR